MQDNHSFDNYFGTYPRADGIPSGACQRVDTKITGSRCVAPFHLAGQPIAGLADSRSTFWLQYNGGRMDGFVHAFRVRNRDGTQSMGYYDGTDVPLYWNIAHEYVLFDRFFASSRAGNENRMFWIAGSSPASWRNPGKVPTIFDRLDAAHIAWKFYVEDYAPSPLGKGNSVDGKVQHANPVPLLTIPRYRDDDRITNLDQYFEDLHRGRLPSIAYIATTSSSDKPPASPQPGQRLLHGLLNALMASGAWESSAFLVTYDGWGGWYDHVLPPRTGRHGHGFRVPALLISPYAREGFIDHTELDHASILRFIERNYGVKPLGAADAGANDFMTAFDFGQPARRPKIVSLQWPGTEASRRPQTLLLAIYALGIGMGLFVMATAAATHRTSVRRSPKVVVPFKSPSGER